MDRDKKLGVRPMDLDGSSGLFWGREARRRMGEPRWMSGIGHRLRNGESRRSSLLEETRETSF